MTKYYRLYDFNNRIIFSQFYRMKRLAGFCFWCELSSWPTDVWRLPSCCVFIWPFFNIWAWKVRCFSSSSSKATKSMGLVPPLWPLWPKYIHIGSFKVWTGGSGYSSVHSNVQRSRSPISTLLSTLFSKDQGLKIIQWAPGAPHLKVKGWPT